VGAQADRWRGPTRTQLIVVVAVFVLALVVARTCQEARVRVEKDQAIAIAKREVDFVPRETQIRFLRQGIGREPFWFVSLGVPIDDRDDGGFSQLAVVKIDANTGKVDSIEQDELAGGARSREGESAGAEP
jgi:hypothetical protein